MECAIFLAWTAALGFLHGYEIELDGVVVDASSHNRGQVCIPRGDVAVHTIQIFTLMADGSRVGSEPAVGTREMLVGATDPGPPILEIEGDEVTFAVPHPINEAADFNGDGTVGIADFGALIGAFGSDRE